MKIMFVGLGLIGGSMALALQGFPELERYAVDCDEWTRFEALGRGAVRAAWPSVQEAPLGEMDVVVLCLHPEAAADFVRHHACRLRPGALLTDVWGYDYAGDTNVVDVYIRYLRHKIDEPFGIKTLHTIRAVGYMFRVDD